jgi:hypothetical protein
MKAQAKKLMTLGAKQAVEVMTRDQCYKTFFVHN